MVIQFTLQDLLLFLGCALLAVIGVFLIAILWKTNKVIGVFRSMVESNQDSINKTIRTLPGIMENAEQISGNVKVTTDQLKVSGPAILKDAEFVANATKDGVEIASAAIINVSTGVNDTVDAIKQEAEDFGAYFHIAAEIIKIIIRAFSSGK
ncbi:MAG: hypothetical protein WCG21_11665 [Eubacteriales bacterium]